MHALRIEPGRFAKGVLDRLRRGDDAGAGEAAKAPEEEPIRLTDAQKAALKYVGGFSSQHPCTACFLFGDGAVKTLADVMDFDVYQRLGHRDDGMLLKSDKF